MSWGLVGFAASLIPWSVLLLGTVGVVHVPCQTAGTAAVKAMCCASALLAVSASIAGLRLRAGVGWAVCGLVLGLAFGIPFVASEPAAAGVLAIPTATVGFVVAQWRQ